MSIYATIGTFCVHYEGVGGRELVEVMVQGVPPHIGHPDYYRDGDPYADFLPPPVEDKHGARMRAVFFIFPGTEKVGQRYVAPLLMLTGAEWDTLPFPDVWERVERAVSEAYSQGRCTTCGQALPDDDEYPSIPGQQEGERDAE